MKFCYNTNYTFLTNRKDLDPSYKTDLDLWDCFGRKNLRLITEEIRYEQNNMKIIKKKTLFSNKIHM